VRRHHLHPHLAGLALPGHSSRPRLPTRGRLGDRRPPAHRPGRERATPGRDPAPPTRRSDLPLRQGQYASTQFAAAAGDLGVRLSVGRRGQCWDNAVSESFFATIKTELLDDGVWPTHAAAKTAIFEYIESDYNLRRRHSTLGYLSPAAYEATAAITESVA
jgi:transposase InsO family protein